MACRHRAASVAPEITLHDCAIESMRHASLMADPSGVPSSKYARRYQLPSQASRSSDSFSAPAWSRHALTRSPSPRASASLAHSDRIGWRNQASQTLSPFPSAPTRFIPSFQSPVPISGKPWLPTDRLRSGAMRSEQHTSELQSRLHLVCRLLLEKKKKMQTSTP